MKWSKTARAICAITTSWSKPAGIGVPSGRISRSTWCGSTYLMPICRASTMTLIIIVTAIIPSSSSVVAALRDFGLRNAGTPLEIASTPVSAAQPEENARASRKIRATVVSGSSQPGCGAISRTALSTSGRVPLSIRMKPHAHIPRIAVMKRYVGTAKNVPDSRTPRRFSAASTATAIAATMTSCPFSDGNAADAYDDADETDTATVRM